jgi:hypothetical protein
VALATEVLALAIIKIAVPTAKFNVTLLGIVIVPDP